MIKSLRKYASLGSKLLLLSALCCGGMQQLATAAEEAPAAPAANGSAAPASPLLALTPEEKARNDAYMRNIVPVYFPAVPFGWNVLVQDNTVSYLYDRNENTEIPSKVDPENPRATTTIRMQYTRKTMHKDAAAVMDEYVSTNACNPKVKEGTGFYTASCLGINTYAIVIGEADNLYLIELTGEYNNAARAIIESYVGNIISGKRVFADRNIGDMTDRDPM